METKNTGACPLELHGCFEERTFNVRLVSSKTVTVADLAGAVHAHTGLPPSRQRIEYKGIVFDPPDTDKWAPLLDDLNFRSGDRFDVFKSARPLSESEAATSIRETEISVHTLGSELEALGDRRDRVHQGFVETGNQLMALSSIKQSLDTVKEKLMVLIKDLNELNLDHRNFEGQARRRETVDCAQRQLDKCVDASTTIFHKLAQSQQLSHNGPLFAGDPMLASSRSWRNSKRAN